MFIEILSLKTNKCCLPLENKVLRLKGPQKGLWMWISSVRKNLYRYQYVLKRLCSLKFHVTFIQDGQ